MIVPVRVKLSRGAGWRMPVNTLKVDRSTNWGNPFVDGALVDLRQVQRWGWIVPFDIVMFDQKSRDGALVKFQKCLMANKESVAHMREQLRGKNLACWCDLDAPCHADLLLELANI